MVGFQETAAVVMLGAEGQATVTHSHSSSPPRAKVVSAAITSNRDIAFREMEMGRGEGVVVAGGWRLGWELRECHGQTFV